MVYYTIVATLRGAEIPTFDSIASVVPRRGSAPCSEFQYH